MKTLQALCLILPLAISTSFAQNAPHPPVFADYAVAVDPAPTHHKPVLATPQSRRYASMLREAAAHTLDFAGHYVLASWGCGASCIMAAAIDVKDGTVVWVPFTVCCWPMDVTEPLEYKPDSRLLIVRGQRNEKGSSTSHYYILDPPKRRIVLFQKP